MSLSFWLFLYRLTRQRPKAAELPAPSTPVDPVIWVATDNSDTVRAFLNIAKRLSVTGPDIHLLITGPQALAEEFGNQPGVDFAAMLGERASDMGGFLERWKPVICFWDGMPLRPGIVLAGARTNIPMVMLNFSMEGQNRGSSFLQARLRRHALRQFRLVFALTHADGGACIRMGLPEECVLVRGEVSEGLLPLDADLDALDALADILSARDIWLAAQVTQDEEAAMLEVHRNLRGTNRRLLLVLNPRNPEDGDRIADMLKQDGWRYAVRSQGLPVTEHTQIYVADEPGELGLWYRLAPISYLGGTLSTEAAGTDPRHPGALGSAIVHGPRTAPFREVFEQLHNQVPPAATQAVSAEGLAKCISDLLSPDRAAAQAHAAWEYVSRGAELTDHLNALITEAVNLSGSDDARTEILEETP